MHYNDAAVEVLIHDLKLPYQQVHTTHNNYHSLNGAVAAQALTITAMEKWSLANDIRYTPTLFLNGYELPADYDLEALTYFLQE